MAVTAIRAEDFIQSLGVNTHIIYGGTSYTDTAAVLADLQYIGVDHVRDQLPPSDPGYWNAYEMLMAAGIKFDLLVPSSQLNISSNLQTVDGLLAVYPSDVDAIEGLNEIDGQPDFSYGGQTGLPAAVAYQQALYVAVKERSKSKGHFSLQYDADTVGTNQLIAKHVGYGHRRQCSYL